MLHVVVCSNAANGRWSSNSLSYNYISYQSDFSHKCLMFIFKIACCGGLRLNLWEPTRNSAVALYLSSRVCRKASTQEAHPTEVLLPPPVSLSPHPIVNWRFPKWVLLEWVMKNGGDKAKMTRRFKIMKSIAKCNTQPTFNECQCVDSIEFPGVGQQEIKTAPDQDDLSGRLDHGFLLG